MRNKAVLIDAAVHDRLKAFCDDRGLKIKFVTETAIANYVAPRADAPQEDEVPA